MPGGCMCSACFERGLITEQDRAEYAKRKEQEAAAAVAKKAVEAAARK